MQNLVLEHLHPSISIAHFWEIKYLIQKSIIFWCQQFIFPFTYYGEWLSVFLQKLFFNELITLIVPLLTTGKSQISHNWHKCDEKRNSLIPNSTVSSDMMLNAYNVFDCFICILLPPN